MLELRILQNKKSFTKLNGDVVVDLIRRAITFIGIRVKQGRTYIVEDGIEMRPDLISKAFYQNQNVMCLLLKYNGISNPFSINAGDYMKIPDDSILTSMSITPTDLNGSNDNWQTSTRKKKKTSLITPRTRQDKSRLDYLQSTALSTVAPPNVAKDDAVKVVNGKIIFGADVTSVKKEDCPDPISRTKLLATLTKNKIFG